MLKTEIIRDKRGIREILSQHFALRIFKTKPIQVSAKGPTVDIADDDKFWSEILDRKIIPGSTVNLNGFHILEWFPRTPGLYHHPKSKRQRPTALQFIDRILSKDLDEEETLNNIEPPPRARRPLANARMLPNMRITKTAFANFYRNNNPFLFNEFSGELGSPIVFDPYGKQKMLESGVGAVRLQPQELNGETCWLCSGTSLGWADHGVPLAIPDHIYQKIFPEIRDTGCVMADVVGQLRFVSRYSSATAGLSNLIYDTPHGIPHVYVFVSDLRTSRSKPNKREELKACAAVTFVSDYEGGSDRTYATYVGFNPGIKNNLDTAVQWLSEKYVASRYNGRIVTDFDEQVPRFSNILFSLRYVNANTEIELGDVQKKFKEIGMKAIPGQVLQYIQIETLTGSVNDMSRKIDVSGTVGIVAGGSVSNTGQVAVSSVAGAGSKELENLLRPFIEALSKSSLPASQEALIKAQIDILREEGIKPREERNQSAISAALSGLKSAVGIAATLKSVWDMFGAHLMSWFDASSIAL